MKIYLVGGAVRDQLLERTVTERDWVVVGATEQQMLSQGFRRVGKDFPVFLHPITQEEYALARTERKTGRGYHGFSCHADPDVTLEQDLLRRDLTINAIAQDPATGQFIDPFQGRQDLKDKLLRHVSPAFNEDPLRVLRVARFAARFAHLGFKVHPNTMTLMTQIANSGELADLTVERVWLELHKALKEKNPEQFFYVLHHCQALAILFPEIDGLFGVPNPEKWHPEIDSGVHTMMVLQQAAQLTDDVSVRFAALLHDLGKTLTPQADWPKHRHHEQNGVALVEEICQRLRVPGDLRELAVLACRYHLQIHDAFELRPQTLLQLLEQTDCLRRRQRFEKLLLACQADSQGRLGFENTLYPQKEYLQQAADIFAKVEVKDFLTQGLKGEEIKQALHQQRLALLKTELKKYR